MRAHTRGSVTSFVTMREMQGAGVRSYILQGTMWAMQCIPSSRKTYPCQHSQCTLVWYTCAAYCGICVFGIREKLSRKVGVFKSELWKQYRTHNRRKRWLWTHITASRLCAGIIKTTLRRGNVISLVFVLYHSLVSGYHRHRFSAVVLQWNILLNFAYESKFTRALSFISFWKFGNFCCSK
jgi:hypothetical protein